jgi:two-component system phosphate regulon sensor histidine kinase PhoR
MSHEFKTPIATINLALDAISNPKVIETPNKVSRYVKMIREENSRMLSQVENVLRISQLERSNQPIHKTIVDTHRIIIDAINHIQLILKDKSGDLKMYLNAKQTLISGNKSHFTNVIINLLDNAVKYCDQIPKVMVETYNEKNNLFIKIKDNGIGMTSVEQKRIFDKFFRAASGDIHNVKGHGLGLAYVKKIIDLHKGEIKLKSKKDFGTIFIIRIPNINIE